MLKLIYSNDLRNLAEHLAQVQQAQPLPPLEAETVIVQSNELARWLSLLLAEQQGIASHIDFPYPSAFIWTLFRRLLTDVPKQSSFSTDAMTWRLFELLPNYRKQTGFDTIDAYLGEDNDVVKRYELAHRIADTFDQYLMYRPDWIQSWEQGQTPHWQAVLWQAITEGGKPPHRANLLEKLKRYLVSPDFKAEELPKRISIFGLSALPPVYLELFELISQHRDVYIFFLSPSEHYWGDIVSPKQYSKQLLKSDEVHYLTKGHPLLASLGKQGQDFFEQLQGCHQIEETFLFSEPMQRTLLEKLQHDIFALTDSDAIESKKIIANEDDSIMVHSCHSAMREIEVLHDQLLALFERHPELSPTDVVVMTPDIEVYSPWIKSVFSCASSQQTIPYSIADGGIKNQSPIVSAFNTLLNLPHSRFEVECITALLECEAIQQRFSFNQQQLEVIHNWLRETHTHWGLSAQDKAELGLPEDEANTWRAGLDRLLLGYAMSASTDHVFDGKLGIEGVSGERADTMAQLCAFIDCLEHYRQQLKAQRTVAQWQKLLLMMLESFFSVQPAHSQQEAELLAIRKTLDTLVETAQLAKFEQAISIELVIQWCRNHIDDSTQQSRFMGQGVTFCGMVPMRSIPFKVVCLIGMNDASYPRRQTVSGVDLLATTRARQGDRSQRNEDRYLFLEAILSAKAHFYISYIGASIYDNSVIPPSVLVSDVRDVLRLGYQTQEEGDIWQHVFTQHPLQAFSQRYFNNISAKLFSYVSEYCPVQTKQTVLAKNWFSEPLPQADKSWRIVSLNVLLRFYRHPARFLLQERLGLRLEEEEEQLESREPFELDALQAWSLRQQLLQHALQGKKVMELKPLIEATGVLPQGRVGELVFNDQAEKVALFTETVLDNYPKTILEPMPIELQINKFTLTGQLDGLTTEGLFSYRMGKLKASELVGIWIKHLVLNIIKPKNSSQNSIWLTEDKAYYFKPVDDAESLLADLMEKYWQGLHIPLSLFPNTSHAFAKASLKGNNTQSASTIAWEGNMSFTGEKEDLYYQQIYNSFPLDSQFEQIALAVFQPIYNAMSEGEL